jgi:hypothetical protein
MQQHLYGLREEQDRDGQEETHKEAGLEVTDHVGVVVMALVRAMVPTAWSHLVHLTMRAVVPRFVTH